MTATAEVVGRAYPPVLYAVGREKIREFAHAVGEANPVHHDLAAARAAGLPDLLAPPMFAVVYAAPALSAALFDPELGLDYARMVHGAQVFEWSESVVAGDEITTVAEVAEVSERGGMGLFVFTTSSVNQRDEPVCTGTWTNVVRREVS